MIIYLSKYTKFQWRPRKVLILRPSVSVLVLVVNSPPSYYTLLAFTIFLKALKINIEDAIIADANIAHAIKLADELLN